MKRGSSIGAPHVVQIAMGCDGQPILPFFAKSLRGNPSIGGILSALGVVAPGAGVAEPGARRPRAERGNLKAPEVTQLNYRLTTKLHKEKVLSSRAGPAARSIWPMIGKGAPRLRFCLGRRTSEIADLEAALADFKATLAALCITMAADKTPPLELPRRELN